MKLLALAVILSCGLMHAYCSECTAEDISTIQQQWTSTFGGSNSGRLFEFAVACFMRSVVHREFVPLQFEILIQEHTLYIILG